MRLKLGKTRPKEEISKEAVRDVTLCFDIKVVHQTMEQLRLGPWTVRETRLCQGSDFTFFIMY